MKKIYKYTLEITGQQTVKLPVGSKFLTVQSQKDKSNYQNVCMWFEVDPNQQLKSDLIVRIFGTGHEISEEEYESLIHVGTVQQNGLVWHVYFQNPHNA